MDGMFLHAPGYVKLSFVPFSSFCLASLPPLFLGTRLDQTRSYNGTPEVTAPLNLQNHDHPSKHLLIPKLAWVALRISANISQILSKANEHMAFFMSLALFSNISVLKIVAAPVTAKILEGFI